MFETHGIGQTSSSLERYLVYLLSYLLTTVTIGTICFVLCCGMFAAAGCSQIANRPGITMMYPSPQFHDTVLIFICQPGFQLVGMRTLYCDGQQWSSSPPDCVKQPSTTLSVLLHSSAAPTPSSDDRDVVPTRPSSSQSLTSASYFPASTFDVLLTSGVSRASVTPTGVSATSTSHYLPASSSTRAALESSVATMSTPVGPQDDVNTVVVTPYHPSAGDTLTSLDVSTSKTLPRITSSTVSKFRDSVSLTTNFLGGSESYLATSSAHIKRLTSLPPIASSTHAQSNFWLQSGTASQMMTDTPLTNGTDGVRVTESSVEEHGSRKLVWYAVVAGSCVVALVVAGTVCGVVARRRTATFRRYQLIDTDKSMMYTAQYTELTSTGLNHEQQNSENSAAQTSVKFVRMNSADSCSVV